MNSLITMPTFMESMGYPDSNTKGLMTGAISLGCAFPSPPSGLLLPTL